MMGRTHLAGGLASLWLIELAAPLAVIQDPTTFAPLVIAAAFGALLPDLDASESLLKHLKVGRVKPFLVPAYLLNRSLGHRGVLHSVMGWLFASATAALLLEPFAALALSLGYGSHLLLDSLTRSGIPFWYPNRERVSPLPPRWRISTGSPEEELAFIGFALCAFVLILSKLTFLAP